MHPPLFPAALNTHTGGIQPSPCRHVWEWVSRQWIVAAYRYRCGLEKDGLWRAVAVIHGIVAAILHSWHVRPLACLRPLEGNVFEQRAVWEHNRACRPHLLRTVVFWVATATAVGLVSGALAKGWVIWAAVGFVCMTVLLVGAVVVAVVWVFLGQTFEQLNN